MSVIIQSEKYMTVTVWRHMGGFQVEVKPGTKQFGGDTSLVAAAEVAAAMADWALPQARKTPSLKPRVEMITRLAGIIGERWNLPSRQDAADAELLAMEEAARERQRPERLAAQQHAADEAAERLASEAEATKVETETALHPAIEGEEAADESTARWDWRRFHETPEPIDASDITDPEERSEYLEGHIHEECGQDDIGAFHKASDGNWSEAMKAFPLETDRRDGQPPMLEI